MSLFDKIFRPDKDSEKVLNNAEGFFKTLTAYRPVFHNWKGEIYESELVRAAIDARARHISKLSVVTQGAAQPSLQTKLRLGPNQWQTWSQFLYRVSTILDVHNTVFITPVFDEDLRVTGYFPAMPTKCDIIQYKGEPWLRYKFVTGGTAAVELRRCAILTKYQLKDDFFGTSNRALNDTMQLIGVQRQGIEESAKNSATYRFIAKVNNFTKTEDLARERKRFSEENLSSDSEAGGLLLFPNTYTDIQQIKDQAYTVDTDQLKLIQTNVFNYFGVNEKILQSSASGDELDAFFNGAIEPFAIQFSEAMTKAIFSERERAQGSSFIANANRLQYMNVSAKVSMAQQLGDRGAILIDEIRELFNYPPLPDGQGQHAPIRGEYYYAGEDTEASQNEPEQGIQNDGTAV